MGFHGFVFSTLKRLKLSDLGNKKR